MVMKPTRSVTDRQGRAVQPVVLSDTIVKPAPHGLPAVPRRVGR
jgi:hypothetical protein